MITGTLRLFTDAQLDRLHGAVLRVLGETGVRIYSDVFLSALAAVGASVDRARGVARCSHPCNSSWNGTWARASGASARASL